MAAVINITPSASGEGLRKDLDDTARSYGVTLRTLVAAIYTYAVSHQKEFTGALQNPKRPPGQHIGTSVSDDVGRRLTGWAKARKTPRGIHCNYVLEKALELKLAEKVLAQEGIEDA
ncbi:MAG TPA: hypothetical protein VF759_11225 [Allosphingosinicella sp.]